MYAAVGAGGLGRGTMLSFWWLWIVAVSFGACAQFQKGPFEVPDKDVQFVDVEGWRIRVQRVGTRGSPVVLIHGFGSSLSDWKEVAPRLCADHQCLMLDLPGFGWSDKYEGVYTPARLASFVLRTMDAVGFRTAHVVAHSWGSSVALALALEHPERVDSLTLTGAWVYYDQLTSFFLWARIPGLGEGLFTLFFDEQAELRYRMVYSNPHRFTDYERVERIRRVLKLPGFKRAALQAARDQNLEELEKDYGLVGQDTLLIWGEDDHVSFPFYGRRLLGDLPRAQLVVIPGSGHAPQVESAEIWGRTVLDFLAGLDRKRAEVTP